MYVDVGYTPKPVSERTVRREPPVVLVVSEINPYLMNGFSHHYQLGESTFIFRGLRSDF